MRKLTILILVLALGCKQTSDEVNANSTQAKERWFFWSVDWHPTEDQFAVGGSNDTFLVLLSSTNFQELKKYPYKGTITKVKWHPTKNALAMAVQDGKSKSIILNIHTQERVQLDSITSAGARAIGWNHTGDLLAVGDNDGFLTFFDADGHFLKKLDTGQKGLISLDWHPTKNVLVTVGNDITLYNYDLDSMNHIIDRDEDILMLSTAWHPSGEFFVTGDYGDFQYNYRPLLQYWTESGERIKSIKESKAELRNLKWSSDGGLLATASEKIRLWDTNGELVAEAPAQNLLWGVDWNTDNSKLVTTDNKGRIIVWDKNLKKLKELQY